jgi:protein involved in temperature-dependent protein secretion
MNESINFILTVRYVSGVEQKFEFTAEEQSNLARMATYLQKLLNSRELIIQLEDRLLIIPFQNIQSLEISPPPPKLPDVTFRNVRLIDS